MARADAAPPLAVVGDRLLTGLADVTSDLAALDGTGYWRWCCPSRAPVCARFDHVGPARPYRGRPGPGSPRGVALVARPGAVRGGGGGHPPPRSGAATCTR
ncbi:MAG: hypothetical protein R2711_16735 [Acidimicrobiales bacterium]